MKKIFTAFLLTIIAITFSGCGPIGAKSMTLSVIYAAIVILSLLLFVGYCILIKEKLIWFYLLFGAVAVVNTGYLAISIATTLEGALMANRIAYLGSVLLPLSMLMIIMHTCRLKTPKPVMLMLVTVSLFVFLVAASPGILDIYYSNVDIEIINGVAILQKEYGPWHPLYLVYLVGYFTSMIAVISYAAAKKKLTTTSNAIFLLASVLINIAIWLAEQLVRIDFEILSVSYIFTEVFLITFYMMIQENSSQAVAENPSVPVQQPVAVQETTSLPSDPELLHVFAESIALLTATEHKVYDLYVSGKSTAEVLEELGISQNTLKYHNRNIYGKLGVSSRKQLIELALKLKTNK